MYFIDTNIFLRHLLQDHAIHSPKASAFLKKVENGEIRVRTNDIVIFEVVFTLDRSYKKSKKEIQKAFLPLILLPGIMLPGKRRFKRVFELYTSLNLPFADVYHTVCMEKLKLTQIVTFDREFDRISGVVRIEP